MSEPCFCGRCLAERNRYDAGVRRLRRGRGGLAPCDKVLDGIVAESVSRVGVEVEAALREMLSIVAASPATAQSHRLADPINTEGK